MLALRVNERCQLGFVTAVFALLLLIVDLRSDDASSSKGAALYFPLDWTAIRTNSKWVGIDVEIDGYLDFSGTGDSPEITLWDTQEAMKQHRDFHYISVDTSASEIIARRFGSGADNWRVLQGTYVRIHGKFKIEDEGMHYLGLGHIKSVNRILVMNNGLSLLDLK